MDIQKGEVEIKITHSYEYVKLFPNVFAYRLTTTDPRIETEVVENITDSKGMTKVRKGIVPDKMLFTRLTDDFLGSVRKVGITAFLDHYYRANKGSIKKDMFDYIVAGGSLDNIVRLDLTDHSIWRVDGSIMPTPLIFSYITGGFDNSRYNLHRLAEVLAARDDVKFINSERDSMGVHFVDAPEIESIPYYNRTSTKQRHLAFVWTPTQEQAEIIRAASKTEASKVVFEHDMLGAIAGGAAKYSTYYEQDEETGDDEDDL